MAWIVHIAGALNGLIQACTRCGYILCDETERAAYYKSTGTVFESPPFWTVGAEVVTDITTPGGNGCTFEKHPGRPLAADEQLCDRGLIDIGHHVKIHFMGWAPDRALNPQYAGIPDVDRYGLSVEHLTAAGEPCRGAITFDGEVARRIEPNKPKWTVECWEPLTVSPSLLCSCGHHGWIREGRWVPA